MKSFSEDEINSLINLSESFEFNIEIHDSEYISKFKVSKSVLTFYYKILNCNIFSKLWKINKLKSLFHLKFAITGRENAFTSLDWKSIQEKKKEIEDLIKSNKLNPLIN